MTKANSACIIEWKYTRKTSFSFLDVHRSSSGRKCGIICNVVDNVGDAFVVAHLIHFIFLFLNSLFHTISLSPLCRHYISHEWWKFSQCKPALRKIADAKSHTKRHFLLLFCMCAYMSEMSICRMHTKRASQAVIKKVERRGAFVARWGAEKMLLMIIKKIFYQFYVEGF